MTVANVENSKSDCLVAGIGLMDTSDSGSVSMELSVSSVRSSQTSGTVVGIVGVVTVVGIVVVTVVGIVVVVTVVGIVVVVTVVGIVVVVTVVGIVVVTVVGV